MIKAWAATEAGGQLKPFEYAAGPLGPHDVEINVEHCGICHSDLSMVNNEWGISSYPLVPGHEVIGTLGALGSEVKHLKVGQRVGLGWHAGYCMHCSQCMSGNHNLCQTAQPTIVSHHGGFAEQVRATAASVVPLPEGVDAATAGPLFCGGVTVFTPLVQFGIAPTARVGVIGIGGLGHLALQFLRAWGCEVTAFSSNPAKHDELLKLGAHRVLNSREPAELKASKGYFDYIISTVNVSLDWNAYIELLRPKGRLHFVGVALEPLGLAAFPLIGGQISVSGSPVGSPSVIATMLEFCARHKIAPVSEHFRFDQINEALAHLAAGKARYRLVLHHG